MDFENPILLNGNRVTLDDFSNDTVIKSKNGYHFAT